MLIRTMRSVEIIRLTGIVVSLLSTSLSTLGQNQQSSGADEAAEAPATGAIRGKVINENGQALPDAAVLIRAYGSSGPGQMITTNRDGTFESSGLDRLVYLISAFSPAYTTQPRDPDSTESTSYRVGRFSDTGVVERWCYHRQRNGGGNGARRRGAGTRANDPRWQRSTAALWINSQRPRY